MRKIKTLLLIIAALSTASCISIKDITMNYAADMLSSEDGGGNIFTSDNDPELVGDALPLALKMYEMILASKPEHSGLQFATGKNFIIYANGFIQTPAGMLPDEKYIEAEKMLIRAENMYIRGRDYILEAIELNHEGFGSETKTNLDNALQMTANPEDAAMLYWAASGWIAAYSCDPMDFEMANSLYIPAAMLFRALELDEDLNRGAIHDVLIQIYSSLPNSHIVKAAEAAPETVGRFISEYYKNLQIDEQPLKKAKFHFNRALELANRQNPGTYCSYAKSVSVKNQNYSEYKMLLEKALAIDPDEEPDNRLVTIIYQEKAAWMLEHAEDFFISIED